MLNLKDSDMFNFKIKNHYLIFFIHFYLCFFLNVLRCVLARGFNPSTWEAEANDLQGFKASLSCVVSSNPAWTVEWDSGSAKNNNKTSWENLFFYVKSLFSKKYTIYKETLWTSETWWFLIKQLSFHFKD